MNEIQKKRIEEAAWKSSFKYLSQDRIEELELGCHYEAGFMEGAEYALSHQWIRVEEALPENRVKVLVKTKKGRTGIAWLYQYKTLTGELSERCWSGGYIYVTHWLPIPKFEPKK